eukprot:gene2323-8614_t
MVDECNAMVFAMVEIWSMFGDERRCRADVRNAVVFAMVEIWQMFGDDRFQTYMDLMTPTQQKLVAIYYERAQDAEQQQLQRCD